MTTPAPRPRASALTATDVRAVMFGRPVDGVTIVRQARRLTADDSDELALLDARGIWWVARRTSDRLSLWLYIGDQEAETAFERLAEAAAAGERAWTEAQHALLEASRRDDSS